MGQALSARGLGSTAVSLNIYATGRRGTAIAARAEGDARLLTVDAGR